jgi:hypothetical protein
LFESNEAAIDLDKLEIKFASRFEFGPPVYSGNLGYLLVFNSMVFRVPHWLKQIYSPALLGLERAVGLIQDRKLSCFVVCQWRKLSAWDGRSSNERESR